MKETLQKMFDKAYLGVLAQGKASVKFLQVTFLCQYRSPDGCKCAIGHLIPDDSYDPRMEGVSWSDKIVRQSLEAGFDLSVDTEFDCFLGMIQEAHDEAADFGDYDRVRPPEEFLREFKMRMEAVAVRFDLSIPVVPEKEMVF